jgi:hypothetical protein
MHCTLETVPGFSFLQRCCGGDEVPQPTSDCQDDSCSAVESGSYKVEDNPTVAPDLALLLVLAAWDCATEPRTDSAPRFVALSPTPPELPQPWQFSHRTALPPRAPSLAA